MLAKGFRPALPPNLYPSLAFLIKSCWQNEANDRPSIDELVHRLQTVVAEEVARMPEPDLTLTEVAAVAMGDLGTSLRIAGDLNSGRSDKLLSGGSALDSSSSDEENLTMAQEDDIGLETTLRIARLKPQLEKWKKKAAARRVKNRRLKLQYRALQEQMANKDDIINLKQQDQTPQS